MNLVPDIFDSLLIVAGLIAGYFLPLLIALMRGHHRSHWIFFLNALGLITGGVTWLVALLWAFMPVKEKEALANRVGSGWW